MGNLPRISYPEGEERLSGRRWDIDASRIRVLTLGRNDTLEGLREREVHVHVIFSAHHLQGLDGRHPFRPLQRPNVAVATDAPQANHLRVQRIIIRLSFEPFSFFFYSSLMLYSLLLLRFPTHCPTRTTRDARGFKVTYVKRQEYRLSILLSSRRKKIALRCTGGSSGRNVRQDCYIWRKRSTETQRKSRSLRIIMRINLHKCIFNHHNLINILKVSLSLSFSDSFVISMIKRNTDK